MNQKKDDIRRVLEVARKLLTKLEVVADAPIPEVQCEKVFGSRSSPISLLVALGGLILKLHAADDDEDYAPEEDIDSLLTDRERALLQYEDT